MWNLLWNTQKCLSKNREISVFYDLVQFPITKIVKQHPFDSDQSNIFQSTGDLERNFRD